MWKHEKFSISAFQNNPSRNDSDRHDIAGVCGNFSNLMTFDALFDEPHLLVALLGCSWELKWFLCGFARNGTTTIVRTRVTHGGKKKQISGKGFFPLYMAVLSGKNKATVNEKIAPTEAKIRGLILIWNLFNQKHNEPWIVFPGSYIVGAFLCTFPAVHHHPW